MDNPGEPFTYWQSIAHAADNGSLYLDAEAAKACSSVCDEYIKKLIAHKASAADLTNAHGWGAFASGEQLRDVIAKKAMGGENSLVDVLQSHIDVVEEMRFVFTKFFVETTGTDEINANDLQARRPR